ncbi:MAG: tRNA 2-thiocytidine biosynthesis protein TtcA [Lachnospiraceae bacterium]|nr:tRNA 2-thiocytidine biosynthesis protein TtcA [Lachnospiraceae bacterium]
MIEKTITKTFRSRIWRPFITAIKKYELIEEGDRIAVCISGGKDSMLMALLFKMLHRYSIFPFEAKYISMDPGYSSINRQRIIDNAAILGIPVEFFQTDIFAIANSADKSPCYLCARMRRGALYSEAKKRGCNKIALGHHFSDVIETTVMAMFYGSQLQGMLPKLKSRNFEGMELIRPLYMVHEDDIIRWRDLNQLTFLCCACRFTERNEHSHDGIGDSKRQEVKELIRSLKKTNPGIEKSIFNSLHAVNIETFPGLKGGDKHY